jgi:EAL domain-containing protein (putative c-di-GMP-specific phosphodiesterase class I)
VIAVNLSALQFKAPRDLESDINAVLTEYGLPPYMLDLELTESVLMVSSRDSNGTMERLRSQGARIAIDDFGTGYSSLLYLRRFPVDRIKVAREFVRDLATDPNDAAIVNAAGLARVLGI